MILILDIRVDRRYEEAFQPRARLGAAALKGLEARRRIGRRTEDLCEIDSGWAWWVSRNRLLLIWEDGSDGPETNRVGKVDRRTGGQRGQLGKYSSYTFRRIRRSLINHE